MTITQKDVGTVLTGIVASSRNELLAKDQNQLDDYWFFIYDDSKTLEWNLYRFSDLLELYKGKCRAWEEHHNGSTCVVERVRDKYLMPKIKDFISKVKNGN